MIGVQNTTLSRLMAIQAICISIIKPLVNISGEAGVVILADQNYQSIRNNNINNLFIGVKNQQKLQFQDYQTAWNETTKTFKTSSTYRKVMRVFFDYHCIDQSGLDICNILCILLNKSNFDSLAMVSYSFTETKNTTFSYMIQGSLKQRYSFTMDFSCFDQINLPDIYKTDKIQINGNEDSLPINIDIDLDN